MPRQVRKASPILGAAGAAIGSASHALVSGSSRFSHSFELDIEDVAPDLDQPRRTFDEAATASLGATLRDQGQLQPILVRRDPAVRGKWVIVAGERRWRAAKLIGWPKLLVIAFDGDAEVAMLLENLQRVDLSPVEEANGIRRLVAEKGWTQEQAAHALGKTKGDVSGTLKILTIPSEILTGVLTSEHPPAKNVLIELARVEDRDALVRLAEMARAGTLTVKAVREARASPAEIGRARPAGNDWPAGWAVVTRATELVGRLAACGSDVGHREAKMLWRLRNAIDALLSPKGR